MKRSNVQTSRPLDKGRRGADRIAQRRSQFDVSTLQCFDISRRGFTLVESIATITVLAILGSIASFMLAPVITSHTNAATSAQLQLELSMTLDRIERDLKAISRDDAADTTAPDIAIITPTSISWHDNSSLTFSGGEVRLATSGGPPQVLMRNVASLAIQAFDESNQPLGATLNADQCDEVRRLRIVITAERSGISQLARTKLFIRSMMQGGE